MRSLVFTLVLLASACTSDHPGSTQDGTHSTPDVHRVMATPCPASPGDTFGPDECLADSDCPHGGVCSCAGRTFEYAHATRNICVPADCHVDADCHGAACSPSLGDCGRFYGTQTFACHTADDVCGRDSDCMENGIQGYCAYMPEVAHWACSYNFCAG